MIKKQIFLDFLNQAIDAEEKAVQVYAQHLKTAVFWTGIKKEYTEKIKQILNTLATDSNNHKNIVMAVRKQIEEGKRDAF